MLNNADDFVAACTAVADTFRGDRDWASLAPQDIYCSVCGGPRKATIAVLSWRKNQGRAWTWLLDDEQRLSGNIADELAPMLSVFKCLQCGTQSTVLLFAGPNGYELAVFPEAHGGLSTPHTPEPVAYYLDQAKRAQGVGANSAAVAMYRSALEHLLYDQGYTDRMLGPKLAALQHDIEGGTAKKWAQDLQSQYLTVIKKLGDAAIHPGDGRVDRQSALDNALLRQLEITFGELLAVV